MLNPRASRWILALASMVGLTLLGSPAQALEVGDQATDFSLPDASGKVHTLRSFREKRIFEVWYEGKNSRGQNQWLQDEIRVLRRAGKITDRNYRSIGIANYRETAIPNFLMSVFLRQAVKRDRITVLIDRDATMQRLWGFRNGRSNIYVFDETRRLIWKSSGPLSRPRGRQFIRFILRVTR